MFWCCSKNKNLYYICYIFFEKYYIHYIASIIEKDRYSLLQDESTKYYMKIQNYI